MKTKIKLIKYLEHLPEDQKSLIETELSTTEETFDNIPICRKAITIDNNMVEQEDNTSAGYISTKDIDHSGDYVLPDGFDLGVYQKNPVVLYNHDHSQVIAKSISMSNDSYGVKAVWEYADTPFAQEIKSLVKGGFLNTLSIGFVPLKQYTKKDPKFKSFNVPNAQRIIEKLMLLEFSIVTIPDNANAVITTKSMEDLHVSKETLDKVNIKIEKPEIKKSITLIKDPEVLEPVKKEIKFIKVTGKDNVEKHIDIKVLQEATRAGKLIRA